MTKKEIAQAEAVKTLGHEIVFQNGDKICLSDKGNTYIGEIACEYERVFRRNETNNETILAWFERQSGYLPISNIITIHE